MEPKRREERRRILMEAGFAGVQDARTDKWFDLTEKTVRDDIESYCLHHLSVCPARDSDNKWKFAVEKWFPCQHFNLSGEPCDNCRKRKEIFKEVGMDG